ncbi:hypothetical protein HAZT_HAZT011540 [Hyalella azteca]|uniref:Uncharacterized protein n=1 Tax=Hyalella azteca TaxID=294128 RepID=A0A6A0GXK3_HYAAZ|nr:hypothetical protein HAZT_HAZT011540 [Hyalella azteca]
MAAKQTEAYIGSRLNSAGGAAAASSRGVSAIAALKEPIKQVSHQYSTEIMKDLSKTAGLETNTEEKKIERESLLLEKQLAKMKCIWRTMKPSRGADMGAISEPDSNKVISWLSDVSPGVFASRGTAGRDRQLTYGVTDDSSVHQETKPGPAGASRSALDPLARSFYPLGAVNNWSVSSDPNDPLPLSPSLLLTTKAALLAIATDSEPWDLIAMVRDSGAE